MTTITPDGTPDGTPAPGNCSSPRPSLRPGPVVPGTLTAVSHADQSPKAQHAEKGGSGTYPGAPRPERVRPTPWRTSPSSWEARPRKPAVPEPPMPRGP